MRLTLLLLSSLLFATSCASPTQPPINMQTMMDAGGTEAFQKPIDYIPSALGPYNWKITTRSPIAQNYFRQGMQMRYAYGVNDAARSFRMAYLEDPDCAMCYWGEALALGSFLNGPMTRMRSEYAHSAIEKAVELSGAVTELERDLIMAARDRYPAEYNPANRRPVDQGFADRMRVVYDKYPDHHEVSVVYAISLFLLEDRRGYRDVEDPDLQHLHAVLKRVLDDDIKHPGACHLYIHATESSQRPDLALPCAEHLSEGIPVASHIQHMPSHTWNEVGLWGQSVRTNQDAVRSDQMAAANLGFSYGPSHNLHMLLFAASMDGQSAVAIRAGKDYAALTSNNMYYLLTLLRFGRFDEIERIENKPSGEVAAGYWHFAKGYAALRGGDIKAARNHLAQVEIAAKSGASFRMHQAAQLHGLSAAILRGEILLTTGDIEGAIASFQQAAELDDQQPYDEPEPIPYAARHWLGAALMEAGRHEEAEKTYRTELADHPNNVWSLHGLKAALAAQGKTDPTVDGDFEQGTARMDLWITKSRM